MRRIQQYIQFERVLLRTDLILLFNLITFSFFTPVYWLGERVRRSEPIRHWLSMYVTVDKYTHHTTSPAVARNTTKHLSMPFFNFGLMACSSEKRLIHWWEDGNRVTDEKCNIEETFFVSFFFYFNSTKFLWHRGMGVGMPIFVLHELLWTDDRNVERIWI